jgi:hypothetical protein
MDVAEGDEELLGTKAQSINGGTPTAARPEVEYYGTGVGGCTATLIAPKFGLAAGHCTLGYPVPIRGGQFQGQDVVDVFVFGAGPEVAALVGAFNMDVSVFRLASPVTTVTPAVVGTVIPTSGNTVTQIGFGCDSDGVGGGTKQYRQFTFPLAGVTCSGDSGGPLFQGTLASNGWIVGVSSAAGAYDYGNVPMVREDIAAVMRYYESDFEPGVNRVGWDIGGYVTKTTKEACKTECVNTASCRAFTWIAGSNQCWLKSTLARWEGTANTNYWSGVVHKTTAESNTDRAGSDFYSYSATAAACRTQCEKDSRCKAYTQYNGTCYLKSSSGNPVYLSGATSAVRKGPDSLYARRNGTVIQTVEVDYPQPEECSARCANNASCQSWNYRRPMVGLKAQCELMSNAPTPVADSLNSTGTRQAAFY